MDGIYDYPLFTSIAVKGLIMNVPHESMLEQHIRAAIFQTSSSPPSNPDSSPSSFEIPSKDSIINDVKDELFSNLKIEIDDTFMQSTSPSRNSSASSVPPYDMNYCCNSGVEIHSPESPDYQFCSPNTSPTIDSLLYNEESGRDGADINRKQCLVCGDVASGLHYGVASCEACKAFFKRTIQGNIDYTCPASNDCEVNKRCRKACQACRFQKCLKKGMMKEGVRLDRVRGGRQKYRRVDVSVISLPHEMKPVSSLEDNRLLQVLLANEPEPICDLIVEASDNSISVLNILSEIYDKELVGIISWAKQIPGFSDLKLSNQMSLLQSTWTELMTLTVAYRSISVEGQLIFAKDFCLMEKTARDCGAHELYQMYMKFKERLQHDDLRKEEYLLLKALVLANSDVRLDEVVGLKHLRDSIVTSLTECVSRLRGSRIAVNSLMLCLPLLRQSDTVVRQFWTGIHHCGIVTMNKLFVEMLDPHRTKV